MFVRTLLGRSGPALRSLPWALCLLLTLALAAPPTLNPALESRAVAIQKNLRCPLCDTGESIADSRSDISVKMRSSVREQLAAGRSEAQIYDFFAQRYGNFVLLDPPKSGRNLLLWGGPLLALVGGGALWWSFLRRRRTAAGTPEQAPDAAEDFDSYLAQVRRETRPGGQP
ncbi:cytochrome c-type biogenesis protein [Deinococcus koreensis]|uniref:cytochrome c-type biogenesis protein n=1 Tax=Deinococcus koreensis TaxID=2054903 RepID=UPI001FB00FF4|nr:cytochrome c-type biogenesis protein [Deinococcus koreensis]